MLLAAVGLIYFRPTWLIHLLRDELGALTLAEADKYSTNQVLIGVAETSIDANPMLALLPFVPTRGNAVQYQRESAAGNPTFIAPGGTVIEATPTTTQIIVALKILIGDADVDKFLAQTRSKDQDTVAELIGMKARNFADLLGDKFIYGSIDADANEFDGLHELISDDVTLQQIHAGATTTPGPGSFTLLDQTIDLVRPRPTVLLVSRRTMRSMQALARSQGSPFALQTIQGINVPIVHYGEIPVIKCDFIGDVETIAAAAFSTKTGGTASSVFACRFDDNGVLMATAEDPNSTDQLENIIQLETVGTLETKDANRYRLKTYGALLLKDSQAVARLDGISSAAWTN